jgi:hypothetical protein
VRLWYTPEGNWVSLNYFPIPPDLPAGAGSVGQLRDFYAARLAGSGGRLVELDVLRRPAASLRVIVKIPQQPSGLTYVGSLTIPFRDFSYVIKAECKEHGVTGLREAILWALRMQAGDKPVMQGGEFRLSDWAPDDEQYDAKFPDHPVTRARSFLKRVEQSLVIDARVQSLPAFALPDKQQ